MPFLHPSFLDDQSENLWILVLAIATAGCRYSTVDNRDQYIAALQDLMKNAIWTHVSIQNTLRSPISHTFQLPKKPETASLPFIQSVLVSQICHMFSGIPSEVVTMQYWKNILIVLLRNLLRCNDQEFFPTDDEINSNPHASWRSWLIGESRRRLVYSAWSEFPTSGKGMTGI